MEIPKWIDAKEQKPEDLVSVLITVKTRSVAQPTEVRESWWDEDMNRWGRTEDGWKVTAWMPMPPPAK